MIKNCNPFQQDELIDCQEYANNTADEIKIRENKNQSTFVVKNKNKHFLVKLRIDGCLIKDLDKQKCDYLVLDCTEYLAYFVELKGQDLSTAMDQIESSISLLASKLKGFVFCCRIVLTRSVMKNNQSGKARLRKFLDDKYKANVGNRKTDFLIKIGSSPLIEI